MSDERGCWTRDSLMKKNSISDTTQIWTFLKHGSLSVKLESKYKSFVPENEWTWKYRQNIGLFYSGTISLKTRAVMLPTWSSLVTQWVAVMTTRGDASWHHNNPRICFQWIWYIIIRRTMRQWIQHYHDNIKIIKQKIYPWEPYLLVIG